MPAAKIFHPPWKLYPNLALKVVFGRVCDTQDSPLRIVEECN